MKIAYVSNSRFPSEKAQSDQVMAMCFAFASHGHEVTLLVPNRKGVVAEDPFFHYKKPKTFTFKRVSCFDTLRWPWLGKIALWIQTLTFVLNLKRVLTQIQPDVVYSREPYVFGFGRLPGVRCWESHAHHRSQRAHRLMRKLDGIVTLTQASKQRIVEVGVKESRVLVEPDAVDPALFEDMPSRDEARAALGVRSDETLLLYTGKFQTMGMPKGIDEAVQATRIVRSEGRKARFIAVGGTQEDLARYASMQDLDGIRLLPHVPQGELKRFYAAADVLLMPFPYREHYAYYMSPLKLFEYLRTKIPMIVTDLPSVREIVDEQSAFVVHPEDVPMLARVIRLMMDQPQEAKQRALNAYALSERYTWNARAQRIIHWIQAL
ncbi:glycosyltransferase [Candidatus Uhrbacteria bacterium]|nr:glycosyltransferase [Candidatus Uhrbacteria bacterium]MBD3284098.1 glycosyltransferase [Candidatus Uhrbacteria bacterium]